MLTYGVVLAQEHEDTLRGVAWIGRKMNRVEENYFTRKRAGGDCICLQAVALNSENIHTVFIHSDHKPLRFLQNSYGIPRCENIPALHPNILHRYMHLHQYVPCFPPWNGFGADNYQAGLTLAPRLGVTQAAVASHRLARLRPRETYLGDTARTTQPSALHASHWLVSARPARRNDPCGMCSPCSTILWCMLLTVDMRYDRAVVSCRTISISFNSAALLLSINLGDAGWLRRRSFLTRVELFDG